MMRRNLYKAFVLAAGRSAGGFLHSSPFFLSVWRRSWRTGRNTRHHWAPACRTGRTNRRSAARHIVPAPCHAVPRGTVRHCSRSLSRRATWHGSHTVPPSMGGCVPQRVHVRASRRARSRRLPLSRANVRHRSGSLPPYCLPAALAFAHLARSALRRFSPVVPQNLFRGAGGSETNDPGDSVGRWTRRKDCNGRIDRYAQAECWRCVLFLNGVGAAETGRSLLAAPPGANAVVGP